ncbi:MAG: DUF4254 domain-containing protein [Leptospiraceae bacterium]|nr:DUF4254 domain-containing protein [Leptospiraceae bacterium]MCB1320184.1 DUF4254 domain-containing protein [Leptospiraceae bacterium]
MMNAGHCFAIFERCIDDYHVHDNVDHAEANPFAPDGIDWLLYHKCWIDTVQWHLEDLIRNPDITGADVKHLKHRIDSSNQNRVDTVEKIDDWFLEHFKDAPRKPQARLNSETPAWLVDRMSVLALKIYHMHEQTERTDVSAEHIQKCRAKLDVLLEQKKDLSMCLDQLMEDIQQGDRYMKVYRQMKMYNDEQLNPVLYARKEQTQTG